MTLLDTHCSALVSALLDVELMAILRRPAFGGEKTPYHWAVRKEAMRRGLVELR